MALARESLSPLLRNVQGRRLSLELCHKIGLSSPNNNNSPGLSPARNQANVSMNWSPIKNLYSIFTSSDSPTTNSPFRHLRRGSADQNVFKSPSPSPSVVPSGLHGKRRGSLTPISPYCSNHLGGQQHSASVRPSLTFSIPSIHVQHPSPKGDEKCKRVEGSVNENLFCNVTPPVTLRESFDNKNISALGTAAACLAKNSTGVKAPPAGHQQQQQQQRRKSSSSRYDFDEDFMRFVSRRCNLELHPEEILGRGSFGTVIQAKYHGESVAVKVIKTKMVSHLESMKGEQNAFGLNHPHVAQVLDIFQMGPDRSLVVMELLRKGNLGRVLNDPRISIQSCVKIRLAGQIASALQYCHEKGILHLDVKPQNILLDSNDNCKLSDFGASKRVSDLSFFCNINKLEGTVAYKAPELFRGTVPTEKCDVFSFGVCMWQILSREEPYQGLTDHSIIYQVVACGLRPNQITNQVDYKNSLNTTCHTLSHYTRIYENCWQSEPNSRPDMTDLVENLFLLLYKAS